MLATCGNIDGIARLKAIESANPKKIIVFNLDFLTAIAQFRAMNDAPRHQLGMAPRPLSPHLQIYRPQLTSVLSILHRVTGSAAVVGSLLLCGWIMAASMGEQKYNDYTALLGTPVGILLLIGFSWAVFYHLCNGIRHLVWDTGQGLELKQAYASGWAVVIASFVLTGLCWGAVYLVQINHFHQGQAAVSNQITLHTANSPDSVLPDEAPAAEGAE